MTSKGTHGGGDSGPAIAGDPSTFPSDAELSRTLVASSTTASLSTLTESGYPYGSIVSYIPNDDGDPVILVSDLAEHTINARTDSKASMLISEAADGGDPLGPALPSLVAYQLLKIQKAFAKGTYRDINMHHSMLIMMTLISGNYQ